MKNKPQLKENKPVIEKNKNETLTDEREDRETQPIKTGIVYSDEEKEVILFAKKQLRHAKSAQYASPAKLNWIGTKFRLF